MFKSWWCALSALLPGAVLLITLVSAPSAVRAEQAEVIKALHFSGEPVGAEPLLAAQLEADARALLANEPLLAAATTLDETAASLQRGERIRAFAEALACDTSADADLRARSHVRRAWILADLGAVNFGAEHVNQGPQGQSLAGELYLARAWLLWRAGNFEDADREAAIATRPASAAPDWALAAWKQHRATRTAAVNVFVKLSQPDDSTSPEFLAYAEAALAAGAYSVADECYFRATTMLQQALDAVPGTSPQNLFRATAAQRDFLLALLGAPSPATVGPGLWSVAVSAARSTALILPDTAAWERYFSLLYVTQKKVPAFDFADFDIASDLATGEQTAKLAPIWRERFAALLARPDLRYAWQELQAAQRLENHPSTQFRFRELDATYTAEEIAQLEDFAKLHAGELASLQTLRAQLPANTPTGPRQLFITRIGLTQGIRLAAAKRDPATARQLLSSLQALRTHDNRPLPEIYEFTLALDRGDMEAFEKLHAGLLGYSPATIPEEQLNTAIAAASEIEARLRSTHGENYLSHNDLPAEFAAQIQKLCHLRVVSALRTRNMISAERALSDLQRWCDPKQHPAFQPLPDLVRAIADAPMQEDKLTPKEQEILTAIKSGRCDPSFPASLNAEIAENELRWPPYLLLPLAHWRLGQDDLALASITRAKALIRHNRATLTTLDVMVANNDPAAIVRRLVAGLQSAPAQEKAAKAAAAQKDLDALVQNLAAFFCEGKRIELSKLPPNATRVYAFCLAGYIHCRLNEGRLGDATQLLTALESFKLPEPLDLAKPAVENFAFSNDLPDEPARVIWRRLLDPLTLSAEELASSLQKLKPASDAGSISASMAAVVAPYRGRNYQQARSNLATLQRLYGRVRAVSAQLAELGRLLNETDEPPPLNFEESIDSLLERRRNLQITATNYKDANFDALAETYNSGGSSPQLRHLEALCRDIDSVTAQIQAIEARRKAQRDANRQRQNAAREEAYATLRRLMAL